MRSSTSVVLQHDRQSVRSRTKLSYSNPLVQIGFIQLLQRAAVSVQMRSTDSERLCGRLRIYNAIKSLWASAERVIEATAKSDDILLLWNAY